MAGHARQHGIDAGAGQVAVARVRQLIQNVAQKRLAMDRAKDGGGFADSDGRAAKWFKDQPGLGQRGGGGKDQRGVGGERVTISGISRA